MTESKLQLIVRGLPKLSNERPIATKTQAKSYNLILFNTLCRFGLKVRWAVMLKLEPHKVWLANEQGVTVGKRYASYDRWGFCNKSLDQAGWEETIRYFLS